MRRGWSDGGCPYPGRPDRVSAASTSDHRCRKVAMDRSGVSSGHSTGGDHDRREGPNVSPRDDPDRLAIAASTAAIPPRWGACRGGERVKPADPQTERSTDPASPETIPHPARAEALWEDFLSADNLARELRRVERNGGAPGPDGMTVAALRPHLKVAWPEIRQSLDAGTYRPSPVRRVTIPKPGGGERELGVPTVLDRLLQQALSQVLSPVFEPSFSDRSFGFLPGRSAHQAVAAARRAIEAGETWVVDVDLDRFFDRVSHDALLARVARRVGDRRVVRLIRRYLDAGVMVEGVTVATVEGTPQGSPLSPLLANIMLDDLDHELERRGQAVAPSGDGLRAAEHRDAGPARAAQPVHRRLVRLLRAGRDAVGVRRARRVAPASAAPGPLEGVEAVCRPAPQPARPRHPRLAGSPVGGQPKGILAALGVSGPPACPADPLLDRSRSGGSRRSNSSPPRPLTNRRMRTRTSGGVGGGGLTPPPTRSGQDVVRP